MRVCSLHVDLDLVYKAGRRQARRTQAPPPPSLGTCKVDLDLHVLVESTLSTVDSTCTVVHVVTCSRYLESRSVCVHVPVPVIEEYLRFRWCRR